VKTTDVFLAITFPLLWGFGFAAAKYGVGHFPPIFLTACRFGLSALLLVWFVRPPWHLLRRIFLISILSASISYALIYTGLQGIDVSTAALLTQIEVVSAAITAAIFLKEKLSWKSMAGMTVSFIGLMFIFGEPKVQSNLLPVFMVLAGGLSWATGQVLVRTLGQVGGFTLLAWMAVMAAPQLFVSSFILESGQIQAVMTADWLSWATILYLGLIMNGLGYAIWYHLLGRHPVNRVMPYVLLVPVASVATGVGLMGETMTWLVAIGGVIVVAGVAVMTVDWTLFLRTRATKPRA
jgi:O-acetylserine/cysteine efflux transporter